MLSVKVRRQLARLHRMGESRGQWLLEPSQPTTPQQESACLVTAPADP
jgi:hypothetical protein